MQKHFRLYGKKCFLKIVLWFLLLKVLIKIDSFLGLWWWNALQLHLNNSQSFHMSKHMLTMGGKLCKHKEPGWGGQITRTSETFDEYFEYQWNLSIFFKKTTQYYFGKKVIDNLFQWNSGRKDTKVLKTWPLYHLNKKLQIRNSQIRNYQHYKREIINGYVQLSR